MNYLNQLETAILYIENHLEDRITVVDVANAAAYSYYHFHRVFEAVLGETVGNYVRSRRLSKAADELIYTDKRIIDIAVDLQFESQEAFSRAFKKQYHVTPNHYRNNRIDMIIGNRQPMQFTDLQHICNNLTVQPEIVEVRQMRLIGLRFPTSVVNNQSVAKWDEFNQRAGEIAGMEQNQNRYSFFEENPQNDCALLNEDLVSNEFIGMEAENFDLLPKGMETKDFSGGKYAKFTHIGAVETILKTYRYIWGTWIPSSKCELDARDDFECYTDKFLGPFDARSQIDIYIPIR